MQLVTDISLHHTVKDLEIFPIENLLIQALFFREILKIIQVLKLDSQDTQIAI